MFDYEDLRQRLEIAGFNETHPIAVSVLNLAVTLDNENLSIEQRKIVFDLFSDYGIQQLEELPLEDLKNTSWREFDYGNVVIGDFVRVKANAYTAETGLKHNGRLGILISMNAYRCKIKYIGNRIASTMIHPMSNLETIKKVYNR